MPAENRGSNILKKVLKTVIPVKKLRHRLRKKIWLLNLYVPTSYLQPLNFNHCRTLIFFNL